MYTVNEAAKQLNIDPSLVRRLLRSGKLPGKKLGRDWLVIKLDYKKTQRVSRKRPFPLTLRFQEKKLNDNIMTQKVNILEILQECPVLKDSNPNELIKLAITAILCHFNKGETIIRDGEPPNFIYIIGNGLISLYKVSPSGREVIFDIFHRGNILGGISLISGVTNSVGARAITDTDIILISKINFRDFVFRNPDVITKLTILERSRIGELISKFVDLVEYKANERVVLTLNELIHEFGNLLSFTHNDIAQMSCTTLETVTRVMAKLKNSGAIELSRGKVQIIDKDKMLL